MIVHVPDVGKFNVQFIKQHETSFREKQLIDTFCKIFRYSNYSIVVDGKLKTAKVLIAQSAAYQSPKDQYDKVLGKKIALTRALASHSFCKQFQHLDPDQLKLIRTAFWNAFWDEFGPQRKNHEV